MPTPYMTRRGVQPACRQAGPASRLRHNYEDREETAGKRPLIASDPQSELESTIG
jgi:hypothetical protein